MASWENAFLTGVDHACESYGLAAHRRRYDRASRRRPAGSRPDRDRPRGRSRSGSVRRQGRRRLWLVGTIGDAAVGWRSFAPTARATGTLVDIYRRPVPQLGAGQMVAPLAHAMMDVSDGLLLDARRMAEASGCAVRSSSASCRSRAPSLRSAGPESEGAAVRGDRRATIMRSLSRFPLNSTRQRFLYHKERGSAGIGKLSAGEASLSLTSGGKPIELPERLGFEHQGDQRRGTSAPPMADRP